MRPSRVVKATTYQPEGTASAADGKIHPTSIRKTSDEFVPTSSLSNDSNRAAESKPEHHFHQTSGSSKQLKTGAGWYGTWSRERIASTKIVEESILDEKNINKHLGLEETDYLDPKKSLQNERPGLTDFGKSKEMLGINISNISDSDKTKAYGSIPTKLNLDGVKSSMYSHKECLTSPAAMEKSHELKESSVRPKPYEWLGSILAKPNLQPRSVDCVESRINSLKNDYNESTDAQTPETSDPLTFTESLESAERPPIQSSYLTSFFRWLPLIHSSTTNASLEQAPENIANASHDKISDNSSLNSYSTRVVNLTIKNPWQFWTRESKITEITPFTNRPTVHASSSKNRLLQNPFPIPDKIAKEIKDDTRSKENELKQSQIDHCSERAPTSLGIKEGSPLREQDSRNDFAPNHLLPSISSTYQTREAPSALEKISRFMNLGYPKTPNRVFLSRETYKLGNAVVIGVHGLVPAPLLRAVTGQPTGTSVRFVNHTADAIRRWADTHNMEDCKIEKIALEGGGKVAERVENLWRILLNWITHIQKADVIMVACHSQGVPVAIILIARLIEFGVVSKARIGICAMGVSLGPFIEFKSRLIGGSAGELFEFANSESEVSRRYEKALRVLLTYGVRILFCGSIDDQLVSMESSIFSTASHPYIYRAAFIDGRIHSPDFLSHLIGFALKLRNIGISDHGLIRELALPLAGSLYSGEGHSRLHDDRHVYDLAVQLALETTSVGKVPLELTKYKIPKSSNPYLLPWIMRGILEEEHVKTELKLETTELLKSFETWRPTTKALKDVKYRLEAVKSKL